MSEINYKKVKLFLVLTFIINWSMASISYLSGIKLGSSYWMFFSVTYMFIPMFVTIFIDKFIYKQSLRQSLAISFAFNRWFFIAWFTPAIIALATLFISLLFPGVKYSPDLFVYLQKTMSVEQVHLFKQKLSMIPVSQLVFFLINGLIAGITVNTIAGFGEELGWRGFLQRELSSLGFWRCSMIIGFIWGIWHAPLILQGQNYPEHPFIGVFMMILWCMLLAPLFSYVRLKAKSVIAAAIMHGTLNATAGLAIIFITGGNDLITGVTGFAGFIVLFLLNIILALARGRESANI